MSTVRSFEELKSWQKARALTKEIYLLSQRSEFSKDFGFKDQIRRASVSISSNIAEGFERVGTKEFIQFLHYSKGSCGEVKSQLYLAFDLNYISEQELKSLKAVTVEIGALLHGLIKYLKTSEMDGLKYKVSEEQAEYSINYEP